MHNQPLHKAFKNWAKSLETIPLPEHHEHAFLKRLKKQKQYKQRRYVLRWAAMALLFLSLSGVGLLLNPVNNQEFSEFEHAENYLTLLIEEQLNQIHELKGPEVTIAIEKSTLKLNQLQRDYSKLYSQWEVNQHQPQLIPALLLNLRTQLELLETIQIQLINIQQKDYESI
ncbi:MAG: hypothetical protein ACO2Z3_03085 [Flavobacteriaceae bacterium]